MSVFKFRQGVVVAVFGLVAFSVAADIAEPDEILFIGWGRSNRDSLYYLPSRQSIEDFHRYWKFRKLERIFAACGYSYDVFRSSKKEPAKKIASVNLDCGLVEVDGGTYFNQLGPVRRALQNAKLGKMLIDTIYDSVMLKPWLDKRRTNKSFLGFEFVNKVYEYRVAMLMPKTRDSISPMRNDTMESFRNFYKGIMDKTGLRYESIMWFKVQQDSVLLSDNAFLICNVLPGGVVRSLLGAGYVLDTTRIGLVVKSFYK